MTVKAAHLGWGDCREGVRFSFGSLIESHIWGEHVRNLFHFLPSIILQIPGEDRCLEALCVTPTQKVFGRLGWANLS